MEHKEQIQSVDEEALEQTAGGVPFAHPQSCSCVRCGWFDILPPKDWKCPHCGGSVIGR